MIADIHANPYALQAVLNHGEDIGVGRWLVLGDVVASGPEPDRVLDQLAELDVVAYVSGNSERYLLTDDRPGPNPDEAAADTSLIPRLVDLTGSFAWTKGFLQARGSLDQLRAYQPHVRLRFPDGTNVLAVHASLVADDGRGLSPTIEAAGIETLFPEANADLIFGGHTHEPADLTFGNSRFVNPGSISNPHDPEIGACYSVVRLGDNDHTIEQHEIPYDKRLAIDSIVRSGMVGSAYILRRYFDSP